MQRITLIIAVVIILGSTINSFAQEIPFTKDDRDRLIRLETKFEEWQKAINQRFDSVDQRFNSVDQHFKSVDQRFNDMNKRIDDINKSLNSRIDDLQAEMRDLKTFMLWGFGILFGGMGILITVVIWDRRTALSPVIRKQRHLEDTVDKVFREYARVEPKFAEILKSFWF